MLKRDSTFSETAAFSSPMLSPGELLFKLVDIARRNVRTIGLAILATLTLAILYLAVSPAQFTATAVMIMDPRKAQGPLQGNQAVETPLDNPTVESQVEILKSENIALSVIQSMKLADDPDMFAPSALGLLIGSIRSAILPGEPLTDYEKMRAVVEQFGKRLSIKRIGVTFVFEISFLYPDRDKAAQIANAVADAYVADQLEAKYQSTRRAGTWLQDRLRELSKQATDAERAVVSFKTRNNIVDTGGRLLNEQQLSELNSQLAVARAAVDEAQARLSRIDDVMRAEIPDESVTDALHNEVIIKLRNSYVDLSKRAADLTTRLGPAHQAVVNVRNEMREVRRSISEELRRIAQGYRSDFEISKSKLESVQKAMSDTVSLSQTANQAQVELRELESAAQSYRALYDSFLQRYMESVQQQSFPLTEARLVTLATAPLKKSQPKTGLTLVIAIFLGGVIGFGIAWLRDVSDSAFRDAADVEKLLESTCVASVPLLKLSASKGQNASSEALRAFVSNPVSRFAESIRGIKVAIDFFPATRKSQIIGMVSSLPGEGKTTLAANLAELIAFSGARAVLIDGDIRNPSLSTALCPKVDRGLVEVLAGDPLDDILLRTADGKLDFLPTVRRGLGARSNELLSSRQMQALLNDLKSRYDYVIVDLPPLIPLIDARAAAEFFDCFVMVIEWGQTPSDVVQRAVQLSPRIQQRIAGVVLNKVDAKKSRSYETKEYPAYDSSYQS